MPILSGAHDVWIEGCTLADVGRDYNYNQTIINRDRPEDIRNCIYSAMKTHIHEDAFHDSGARRPPSRCYPGTREEALGTISDWVRDSTSHCLWLHGPAGTGKTAIAQTFAEQCHRDGTLGASYFFTKGPTGGPPRGLPPLFPTLVYQLMLKFPGLDQQLWEAICTDPAIFKRSLNTQLEKLIVKPFFSLTNVFKMVVIIDGLDECDGISIQGEIVQLILDLERHSVPLLFLISSRPEPEIRRAFEPSPPSSLTRLVLDKTMHPDSDIRHFLVSEFKRIYQQTVGGVPLAPESQLPWPSNEVIEELVDKSSGHFIYAATVIRFVQEGHAHPADRLDAILQIPSRALAAGGIFARSIAFKQLDELYLHILRKHQNRMELVKILYAIMHSGGHMLPGEIETIFDLRHGSVRIMLEDLHSIIDVPADDKPLRFLHASFEDFLCDPERATHEFHLDVRHCGAEISRAYMRLIVIYSPSKSGCALSLALENLSRLDETADLLSDTLEKLMSIVTQASESTPPCLFYIILDFLLRKVLDGLPGAGAGRKHCETLLERLMPKLVELEDTMLAILRILGLHLNNIRCNYRPGLEDHGLLIGVFNMEKIFQQTLGISYHDIPATSAPVEWIKPIQQIYESLYYWFSVHCPPVSPAGSLPTQVAVDQYTWAWAWDTYASLPNPIISGVRPAPPKDFFTALDFVGSRIVPVHNVDFHYNCLRVLTLEFSQPSNLISPLTRRTLEFASKWLRDWYHNDEPYFDLVKVIEEIDFMSMSQALPDLTTVSCPRLFYLHHGLDELYYCLQGDGCFAGPPLYHPPTPRYQEFLETMYSRLLRDPLAARAVPIIYAMFEEMSTQTIARLLGLAPGVLYRSVAMQGLFGVGPGATKNEKLPVSYSLGVLLKMGRVKLQGGYIDDYIRSAHEFLAISCAKHLTKSHTGPEGDVDKESPGWYAREHWANHLRLVKPSERLFETLRRVVIRGRDIEPVLQWLESSNSNIPEDVLARWHAAWVEHGTTHDPPPKPRCRCLLDIGIRGHRLMRLSPSDLKKNIADKQALGSILNLMD